MEQQFSAIILAGGKSSRMGEDKALMMISGKRLIEIVIASVSALFKDLIIVANKPHLYQKYGLRIETDIVKDGGPLGGIYTGLLSSDSIYNFVVACDMPFLNRDLVSYMLAESQGYDVTIAESNGRLEPLCAVYSKNCITPIESQLHKNVLMIRNFFSHVKVRKINKEEIARFDPEGLCFKNINTPADYRRFNYERI